MVVVVVVVVTEQQQQQQQQLVWPAFANKLSLARLFN